ncbi:MAG: hypothetical protein HYY18_20075 [Planctomycetes bacterium]|nr:hypothetical protein [Planctomycetota bacterium]
MISGEEFLTNAGNNFAMRMLVRWGGPMKGSYVGPYPTREEAFAALRVSKGRIEDGFTTAEFAKQLGIPPPDERRLIHVRWLFEPDARLRHATLPDRTVVAGNEKYAVIFARTTGEPFAVYQNAAHETWEK